MRRLRWIGLAIALAAAGACGDGGSGDADAMVDPQDNDRDGFTPDDGDCDDNDDTRYPGAPEPCDGLDNDCDLAVDEGFDEDGDFITVCAGDCADNDPYTYPGAPELVDGLDNDCDGIIDNHNDSYDDDGDGYSEDQGDCNDDPEMSGALINPGAIEVQLDELGEAEGFDNDCDGFIDEAPPPCANDLPATDPWAYPAAIELCERVALSSWATDLEIDDRSRAIKSDWGDTYVPNAGDTFVVLATGIAADENDLGYMAPEGGTEFVNEIPHPDPAVPVGACAMPDEATVNDYTELKLELAVPTNAMGFSFDFNFMSVEFPEWLCSEFDDTFLAYLESEAFTGNVSFDSMGNRVSINVGFFTVCDPALGVSCTGDGDLAGTGYQNDPSAFTDGGGTGWLTTTAPVVPGEKATLTFMIWDEGDHVLDSAVILDNFRWELEPVDDPITVPSIFVETHGSAVGGVR
jgi:hypothetical protein